MQRKMINRNRACMKNKTNKPKKRKGKFNRSPTMPLQDQGSWLEAPGAFGCVVNNHDHLVEY